MTNYALQSYWDYRYAQDDEVFEWLIDWSDLQSYMTPHLTTTSEILVTGCGTSRLVADLYNFGFPYVTAIDFSEVAIAQMKDRWSDLSDTLEFEVMDMTEGLDYPSLIFDVVIDKAALDAVLCGTDALLKSRRVLREIYRVLKPNGLFFCVSHAGEDARISLLCSQKWKVTCCKVENSVSKSCCFVYLCRKFVESLA
ncbi:hypothetical protein P9112_006729 [Eukaryota sp. TZLM1-RC]